MTIHYLVDTDWIIHYLNGHSTIARRLTELTDENKNLGISIISLAELYEGVYYSSDPQTNEQKLYEFLREGDGCWSR